MTTSVSEKPWSDYSAADYTLAQWHNACLIHMHEGTADYSKGDCKLPVRTPDGTLNRNGVHAATAALAGARGGLDASEEMKAKARRALIKLYAQLSEQAPPSLKHGGLSEIMNRLSHADTGNTTAVIVAVPSQLDSIRLIGDEDKHATILFFGETATLPDDAKTTILNTLEQVSKLMPCFSENIRGISRLGSDDPPALVAMLSNRTLGQVREVLQVNPKLMEYLQNTSQYPNYTPHVTLAYPDYQGEAELRQMVSSIYRIQFDRLALWWNDEHFDFPLYDHSTNDSPEMAMSGDKLENFLAHFGVKGMKWGIRRDNTSGSDTHAGTTTAIKALSAKDMVKAKAGTIVTRTHTATGETKVLIKKKDGSWVETHLSADAERTVKTGLKQSHEMSDREIKEAVARARMIDDYNKFFGTDPNKELEQQVKQLELQKKQSEIHSVLHPSTKAKVTALVASSAAAYGAYHELNKKTDGALSKNLRGALTRAGMKSVGRHAL